MKAIKKIQNLPESKRKIILWVLIVIIGLILLIVWSQSFKNRFKEADLGEINLPNLEIPEFNVSPEIPTTE